MDVARVVILGILLAVVAYFLFGREGLNGTPNTVHMRIRIKVFFFNVMDRIFGSESYEDSIRNHLYFSSLKNERRSTSFYINSEDSSFVIKNIKIKDFHKRFSKKIRIDEKDVDFYLVSEGDQQLLMKASENLPYKVERSFNQGIFVSVKTNADTKPGDYRGEISIDTNCGYFSVPIFLNVVDIEAKEDPSPSEMPDIDEKNGYLGYRMYPLMKHLEIDRTGDIPLKGSNDDSLAYMTLCEGEKDVELYDRYIEKLEKNYADLKLEDEIGFDRFKKCLTDQLFIDAQEYENENERYLSAWKIMAEQILSGSKALVYYDDTDFRDSRYYVKVMIYAPSNESVQVNGKAVSILKQGNSWILYEKEIEADTGTTFFTVKCGKDTTNHIIGIMKPKIIE